jgi:hypothetical protein
METRKILTILVLALGLLVCQAKVSEAAAMATAITYQGRLIDANNAADGLYDFQFKLYDSNDPCSGNKVGSDVNEPDVNVMDGYFTVELNFGSSVFDGNAVWLEVGVRPGELEDPNDYSTLSPRQELTPAPYAMHSENTDTLDNLDSADFASSVHNHDGVYALISHIHDGRYYTETELGSSGSASVHWNNLTSVPAGLADGDDDTQLMEGEVDAYVANNGYLDGASALDWDNITINMPSGFADDVDNTGDTDWAISGSDMFSIPLGNVGIGTTGPAAKLDVAGSINASSTYNIGGTTVLSTEGPNNVFVGNEAGYSNTTGNGNSAMGREALYSNTTGWANSAMGYAALYDNNEGRGNSAMGAGALYSNTDGNENTAIGFSALYSNTTGRENSAVGSYALAYNTTGTGNSAVGFYALANKATGWFNSAVGYYALANTSGAFNSAMGSYALADNTTGHDNTAMGSYALLSNRTGTYNSAMGKDALYSSRTGHGNSAIGYRALYSNTTGSTNSALGVAALYHNTDGNDNTAMGAGALYDSNTGNSNSAVGASALYSNFDGNDNSALGSEALYSNKTGSYNSAVGSGALYSNTTGSYNSAVGTSALADSNTGNSNSALGSYALYSNADGNENTAVGSEALYSNTTGSYNSAVGRSALRSNITGNYNSAMGYGALLFNTAGVDNSAMGTGALLVNTTGKENSAVGSYALYSNITGNYNTAVGYGASYTNSAGSGNVFLGYKAGYYETGDNKLYIANGSEDANTLIYGEFDTKRIGIGTTSPEATLHLKDNTPVIKFEESDYSNKKWNIAGFNAGLVISEADEGDWLYLEAGGDVGIGTTAPNGQLDVRGGEVRIWDGTASVNWAVAEGELYVEDDLEVDGRIFVKDAYDSGVSGGKAVYVDSTGELGWDTSSKRYKQNIAPLRDDFSKILKAQPVTYTAKESKERSLGFIAEDMDELGLTNLVVHDRQGRPETIRYDRVSLYLLEVIKSQNNRIGALEETIEGLESTVQQLVKVKEVQL